MSLDRLLSELYLRQEVRPLELAAFRRPRHMLGERPWEELSQGTAVLVRPSDFVADSQDFVLQDFPFLD